jgi:hypothetical protein
LIKYYEWKKLAYTVMDADEFLGCKDEYCNEEASGDE